MFSGGAQHKSLAAVFGKSSTFVGFVMNHGFQPPCQWGRMGVCCSRVVHRHARMLIGLDVIAIVGVGVVAP